MRLQTKWGGSGEQPERPPISGGESSCAGGKKEAGQKQGTGLRWESRVGSRIRMQSKVTEAQEA